MALLDIERLYADGNLLVETDLDAIVRDIEAMLNTTKLNDDNFQTGGITASSKIALERKEFFDIMQDQKGADGELLYTKEQLLQIADDEGLV